VACGDIQSSLVNLVKVGESTNSLNESPVLSKAHLQFSGSEAHVDIETKRAPVSGKFLESVCALGPDDVQSPTPESPRVEQPLKHSFIVNKGGDCSLSRVNNSLSESSSCRKLMISKGREGDLGEKMCGADSGGEDLTEVADHQTPDRVRHLRALWEQGGRTIQRRWHSKGGTGSLHSGNRYPTRSRSLTYALSDSEIVECNN